MVNINIIIITRVTLMMASGEIYTYLLKERWDFGTIRGATSRRKVCRESPSRFGSSNLSLMSFCLQRGEGSWIIMLAVLWIVPGDFLVLVGVWEVRWILIEVQKQIDVKRDSLQRLGNVAVSVFFFFLHICSGKLLVDKITILETYKLMIWQPLAKFR